MGKVQQMWYGNQRWNERPKGTQTETPLLLIFRND